jgi:septum formation protein
MKKKRKIILASRSPARRHILLEAGLDIDVAYADVDEAVLPREPVARYVVRVADAKAKKVASKYKNAVVIGVDTVISLDGRIIGKPKDKNEARRFLRLLSGRWHKVYTGTVVTDSSTEKTLRSVVVSRVKFARLSGEMINWYVGTGEPMRAAGAYSIQGKGMALVESLNGCLTNVIGVSITVLAGLLKRLNAV